MSETTTNGELICALCDGKGVRVIRSAPYDASAPASEVLCCDCLGEGTRPNGSAQPYAMEVPVANNKYTVIQDATGRLKALRYGEPWRDCCGDNLVFYLAAELAEARLQITMLEAMKRRLQDMVPLFEEARDALPAISTTSARLRGIRLDLADRMDAVGDYEQWKAHDNARQALTKTSVRS
jgi:hypothetical protein